MVLENPPTEMEKKEFRRLAKLLIPFQEPTNFTEIDSIEAAKQAEYDAKRLAIERELAEFRRKYPALAASEDARFERESEEIHRQVFERDATKGQLR